MTRKLAGALAIASVVCGAAITAQSGGTDWPTVGNDPGGSKYSPLTQITPQNVTRLTKAWTYDTGVPANNWRITPLVINNVMYLSTLDAKIVALKADSGTEMWKYDLRQISPGGNAASRGISYWAGTAQVAPRVVLATSDGLLVQIDAKTGALIPNVGVIKLGTGIMEKFEEAYATNVPPAIYKNSAIIAGRTGENGRWGIPGDPRAFDLITGKELWRFHVIPYAGEANFGTWGLDGWQDRRGGGTWVPMTLDMQNGIVFIPTGNATDQNFGNHRPGTNLYAATLLALDADTGKLRWHFQTARHDIFDWDLNAPPTFVEITRNGQKIPAVAQMTKMGYLFILNRLTGEPVFGIEDRPVPDTDAVGDQAWPTQPFPVKPPPLSRDTMSRKDIAKLSPESEKYCQEIFDKSVNMGPYTPYGMVPSLVFPGSEGGGGWGGAAFDAGNGQIMVNSRHLGVIAQLQSMMSSSVLPSFFKAKTPVDFYVDQDWYPCNAPPWSELFAISATTGDIVWRVPLGEYKELTAKGIPKTGTSVNDGGPMVTASGLVFIGASADYTFRAFEAKTGKEIWSATLDESVLATPMTFQGANGKQYVIAVSGGGEGRFHHPAPVKPNSAKIVAYALP